jgi:hypothetical protein
MNTFVGAIFDVGCQNVRLDAFVERNGLETSKRVVIRIQTGKKVGHMHPNQLEDIINDMEHVLKKAREVEETLPKPVMSSISHYAVVDHSLLYKGESNDGNQD